MADKDIDAKETSKVVLYVYKVSCKNFGFSKDSLLTETSDFAILVGQELQEEVCTLSYIHITLFKFGLQQNGDLSRNIKICNLEIQFSVFLILRRLEQSMLYVSFLNIFKFCIEAFVGMRGVL